MISCNLKSRRTERLRKSDRYGLGHAQADIHKYVDSFRSDAGGTEQDCRRIHGVAYIRELHRSCMVGAERKR